MPRVVALIQARMSSERLPNKVLLNLGGRSLVAHLHERLLACRMLDAIVLATSTHSSDDPIVEECDRLGLPVFRGSLDFVTDRLYQAATTHGADLIVRATADCPLLLPELVDRQVITFLKEGPFDYLGYQLPYPEGLADVSLMPYGVLEYSREHAELPSEREHPPIFVLNRPGQFNVHRLIVDSPINDLRFTVDEERDFQMISRLVSDLSRPGKLISFTDLEWYAYKYPEVVALNKDIRRNAGFMKSLAADRQVQRTGFAQVADIRLRDAGP